MTKTLDMDELAKFRRLKAEVTPESHNVLLAHYNRWNTCKGCKLGCDPELRSHVMYRGQVPCEVLFIGEAPGFSENVSGLPFNNPQAAGWVFDAIVDMSLALCPSMKWAVTNAVMCIPIDERDRKKTRDPNMAEIKACQERLLEFVRICNPLIIVELGNVAEKATRYLKQFHLGAEYIRATHPSWMQRDNNDTMTEMKKVMLAVTTKYKKIKGITNG